MISRTDGCRTTRHSTLASRVLLALGVLALAACYLPPFDEKLSESEHFAAGLDHVATLHPVYIDDWMYEGGYFLPSREFDAAASPDGFWVRQSGTDLVAAYMTGSTIYSNIHKTSNMLDAGFVAFPLTEQEISTLSDSTPGRGLITVFGDDAASGILALGTSTSFGLDNNPRDAIDFSPVPSGNIIGASYRIEDSTNDRVSILYQSASSPPDFGGGSVAVTNSADWASAATITSTSDSSGGLPAFRPGAFFGYCSSNSRYYVSGYRKDNSALYAAYWPVSLSSTPVTLSGIAARVSAILSTSRLLAIGDGIMYVYSLEGSLVTSFTTGSMHFAYEYYDSTDGLWYCYFTRAFRVKDNDGWKVYVDVYRCRSTALDSLGN